MLKHMRLVLSILFSCLFLTSIDSQNIDIRLLRNINSSAALPSDKFFRFASDSDPYIVIGVPVALSLTAIINKDKPSIRKGYETLATVAISGGISLALKNAVNRDRPFVTYNDIVKKSKAGTPSFPSGHTSGSFALATTLSLNYPKWYIIAPSFLWAGTVAYSRMDLGVHYPSDVLAGAVIGAGSAWLTHAVNKKLAAKNRKKPCDCPNL